MAGPSKVISLRLDERCNAIVSERARRTGVSFNQACLDAIVAGAAATDDEFMDILNDEMAKYPLVLDLLK